MATGGHLFIPQIGGGGPTDSRPGLHYEAGVGWGTFPVPYNSPDDCPSSFFSCCACSYFDPHNDSLDNIWIGGSNFSLFSNTFLAFYWDGVAWNQHNITDGSFTRGGSLALSRVPNGTEVYASCNGNNEGKCALVKYDGVSSWSIIRSWGSYSDAAGGSERFIPIAIDSDTCVWVATEPLGGLPGYWLDVNTQYSGGDLPVTSFRGCAQLGDGSIFILTSSGDVYRGETINGPFSLDNATDGPFTSSYAISSSITYLSASADGNHIVVQGRLSNQYWVRDGVDDWAFYTPGSQTGTFYGGTPSAIDRDTLVKGSSGDACRVSYDGGTTWENIRGGDVARGGATGSLISDISSNRRMVACTKTESGTTSLWWRGDALHSPWGLWSDEKTDVATADAPISRQERVIGFDSDHLVVSGRQQNAGDRSILHYDPDTDSWTSFNLFSDAFTYSWGTAYEAGKLHFVAEHETNSNLIYGRWNGTDYDTSDIPSSSISWDDDSKPIHIQADSTGDFVLVSANFDSQLFRSTNGGSSWLNVYSNASSVHSDADQVVDIIVVNSSLVYVAFDSTATGTRFSKWDGSTWSVGAPDIALEPGTRSIFVDKLGDLWFFESDTSAGPTKTYKLLDGFWSLEDTFTDSGTGARDVTGVGAMQDNEVLCTAIETNLGALDGSIITLADADLLGWTNLRNTATQVPFSDVTDWGIIPVEDAADDVTGTQATLSDPTYLQAFDFPLQFTNLGNLVLTSNERATEHDMRHAVMLLLGGIPLAGHIGSRIPLMLYDPNDVTNSGLLSEEITRSISINVPTVRVDKDVILSEEDHSVRAIVPYISIGRQNWSVIKLAVPVQDIDDGR